MNEIMTMRTDLANQFAAAGAKLLDFTMTAGALAAIPNTTPQQYAVAGTLESIQAVLPAAETPARRKDDRHPTEPLSWDEGADAPDHASEAAQPATDLQQLKALALELNGAKWNAPQEHYSDTGWRYQEITTESGDVVIGECGLSEAEARFIAASNPAVVLDLIARIESAASPATASGDDLDEDTETWLFNEAVRAIYEPKMGADWNVMLHGVNGGDFAFKIWKAARAAVSAATKPTACALPPAGWYCTRAPGHEGPCAAVPSDNEDGYTTEQEAIYQRGLEDGKAVERGMARYNAGVAARNAATKPAAQAVPEGFVLMPKLLTRAMIGVLGEEDWTWPDFLAAAEVITEDEYNQLIGNDTLAAAPLSANAAQEQARNDALEEAAKLFDENPHAEQFHYNIAEQIRELKGTK